MQGSVVIRADGGHAVGTGHLTRMLRLADRLTQSGGHVTFVSRSPDGAAALCEQRGHALILLPPISEGSGAQAASAISALEPDLIVNDIRNTPEEYMQALQVSGASIVNFDDRGVGASLADVLVDANRRAEDARSITGPRMCFGPQYMVLDEAFAHAHRLPKGVRERIEEVVVFMGGSDPAGLTLRALQAIELLEPDWHTTVLLGYGYEDHAKASALAAKCRNVDLVAGPEDTAATMQAADMALCSGGIVMFELACVGTPSIVSCQVAHELDNARRFVGWGAAQCLGFGDACRSQDMAVALRSLAADAAARRAISDAGKRLVDGCGLNRVMEVIEACVQQS
jgi:spore coat polysaccharide biosynthesis predicted glycosyltransferase SpsG